MKRPSAATLFLLVPFLLVPFLLAACAPNPSDMPPATHTDSSASIAPTQQEVEQEPSIAPFRRATGALASLDGRTSGRVLVTMRDSGEGAVATVELLEFETPYSSLGLGASLTPRGTDLCFDGGLRSGGGDFRAQSELKPIRLPARVEGELIQEIDLYLHTDPAGPCLNTSVARAELRWSALG